MYTGYQLVKPTDTVRRRSLYFLQLRCSKNAQNSTLLLTDSSHLIFMYWYIVIAILFLRSPFAVRNGFFKFVYSFFISLSLSYNTAPSLACHHYYNYIYIAICYCVQFLLSRRLRRRPHNDRLRHPSRVHNRIMHSDLSSSSLRLLPGTYARAQVITLFGYMEVLS